MASEYAMGSIPLVYRRALPYLAALFRGWHGSRGVSAASSLGMLALWKRVLGRPLPEPSHHSAEGTWGKKIYVGALGGWSQPTWSLLPPDKGHVKEDGATQSHPATALQGIPEKSSLGSRHFKFGSQFKKGLLPHISKSVRNEALFISEAFFPGGSGGA